MDSQYKSILKRWNNSYGERQKLQHVYLLLVIISFIVAAIISLLNENTGRKILYVTLFALLAFLANALIWSVLYTNVLSGLRPRSNRR